jgi:hypothetical protein
LTLRAPGGLARLKRNFGSTLGDADHESSSPVSGKYEWQVLVSSLKCSFSKQEIKQQRAR